MVSGFWVIRDPVYLLLVGCGAMWADAASGAAETSRRLTVEGRQGALPGVI